MANLKSSGVHHARSKPVPIGARKPQHEREPLFPVDGFKTTACKGKRHSHCFSLKCSCECHKRGIR